MTNEAILEKVGKVVDAYLEGIEKATPPECDEYVFNKLASRIIKVAEDNSGADTASFRHSMGFPENLGGTYGPLGSLNPAARQKMLLSMLAMGAGSAGVGSLFSRRGRKHILRNMLLGGLLGGGSGLALSGYMRKLYNQGIDKVPPSELSLGPSEPEVYTADTLPEYMRNAKGESLLKNLTPAPFNISGSNTEPPAAIRVNYKGNSIEQPLNFNPHEYDWNVVEPLANRWRPQVVEPTPKPPAFITTYKGRTSVNPLSFTPYPYVGSL